MDIWITNIDGQWVVRRSDGTDLSTHATRHEALAAVGVLCAAALDTLVAAGADLEPGAEFTFTFDEKDEARDAGGMIRVWDANSVQLDRATPLPLMGLAETPPWGHDGAVLVGIITDVTRDGISISGSGRFDTGDNGVEFQRLLADGIITTHSPDMLGPWEDTFECTDYDDEYGYCTAGTLHVTRSTFGGTTMTPHQALDSARIELGAAVAAEADDEEEIDDIAASGRDAESDQLLACARRVVTAAAPAPADVARPDRALPASWFDDPELDGPTAPVVTAEGRVFGHLAVWGTCHIGYTDACVTPPRSESGYAHFHTGGSVDLDNGTRLRVGHLTVGTGHAGARGVTPTEAAAHYDNTGTAAADVRIGEDEWGIWFAGAIRPGVSDEDIWALELSALSGDWRRIDGSLELVAALAVNVPGFPIPDVVSASAGGECVALVAAGSRTMALVADAQRHDMPAPPAGYAQLAEVQSAIDALAARVDRMEYVTDPLTSLAVDRVTERTHAVPAPRGRRR